jgi:glycosyltransferase involved in cell wall biosynthesis
MKNKIKLSIITPYYDVLKYTKELAQALERQLTDEVEWILVDDRL